MAHYEHLPIYKKAMETAVYFENIVKNFSRYNKYNLGAEMRTKSRDIVKLIIKADSSRNRLPLLNIHRQACLFHHCASIPPRGLIHS